jgi:hypothetical protein
MKKIFFPNIFAVFLLGFISNSYAVDTYSFTIKTLTIPQVMVGDTTYNDVVLKLNDFEVISLGADPLVGILDDGLVLQLVSAVKQAGQLHVTLKLTHKGRDKPYCIGCAKARITDNKGSIYDEETVSIPRINKTSSSFSHLLDADTPVTVIYTFDEFDPQATMISLLDIVIGSSKYKLRDIPVSEFEL